MRAHGLSRKSRKAGLCARDCWTRQRMGNRRQGEKRGGGGGQVQRASSAPKRMPISSTLLAACCSTHNNSKGKQCCYNSRVNKQFSPTKCCNSRANKQTAREWFAPIRQTCTAHGGWGGVHALGIASCSCSNSSSVTARGDDGPLAQGALHAFLDVGARASRVK